MGLSDHLVLLSSSLRCTSGQGDRAVECRTMVSTAFTIGDPGFTVGILPPCTACLGNCLVSLHGLAYNDTIVTSAPRKCPGGLTGAVKSFKYHTMSFLAWIAAAGWDKHLLVSLCWRQQVANSGHPKLFAHGLRFTWAFDFCVAILGFLVWLIRRAGISPEGWPRV